MRGCMAAICMGLVSIASFAPATGWSAPKREAADLRDTELPRCETPLARAVVQPSKTAWWTDAGLSNPESIVKLLALRSGCLRLIEPPAAGAPAPRPSVDYQLVLDIGAAAGGKDGGGGSAGIGKRLNAVTGMLRGKKVDALAFITLVETRNSEQIYLAQGAARREALDFDPAHPPAWAAIATTYSDTEFGKVVTAAYFKAYADLVRYLKDHPSSPTDPGDGAGKAHRVTKTMMMREQPSPSSVEVRSLSSNDVVYPTGQKNGVWCEVDDENGNRGWVSSAFITPDGR